MVFFSNLGFLKKKDTDFLVKWNTMILKSIPKKEKTNQNKPHNTKTPPKQNKNLTTLPYHQVTKRIQVQTSKAGEKEDFFFHLSVKCQNVILILPVLRKSKEDYQAIKPSSGSFVV